MYHLFYRYLEDFRILYPLLFGFREESSTMHALISITESICESTDNYEFGCGTVNHSIVINKLNHQGIRGNVHEWFKSYLSHREQFVVVSGHDSISLPLTCGVPQLEDPFEDPFYFYFK